MDLFQFSELSPKPLSGRNWKMEGEMAKVREIRHLQIECSEI